MICILKDYYPRLRQGTRAIPLCRDLCTCAQLGYPKVSTIYIINLPQGSSLKTEALQCLKSFCSLFLICGFDNFDEVCLTLELRDSGVPFKTDTVHYAFLKKQ